MASLIGKEIGKYRITERIGRGGMAEVYQGVHTHLDRKVAIKVLHSHLLEGGDFIARFKREAKSVASLQHPNIVQVYDFDIQDDLIFMVMQYIEGDSLHAKLVEAGKKRERLPVKLIASIISDIAGALDYAHSKGMLHRDIKPSNIMIDNDGKAFLTDFGIAKLLDDPKFTATGQLVGTPAYMSPEQGQGEELSEESDIYSLGVVAFEMLTGQVPYDAPTPIGIMLKQINDPVPSMSDLADDVPNTAQEVIDRALSKSPESRYDSAEELVAALRVALAALVSQKPVPVSVPEDPPTVVDDGLDAPTVTMESEDLDQATVVMEDERKKEKPKEKPTPTPKGEKRKIPIWAYISGGAVLLAVLGLVLTQIPGIIDLGSGGSDTPTEALITTDEVEEPADDMSGEELYDLAVRYCDLGQYQDCIDYCYQALDAGYEASSIYNQVGLALFYLGEHDAALNTLGTAIENDPDFVLAYYSRGLVRHELGDLDGALEDFLAANDLEPNTSVYLHYIGRVYFDKRHHEDALAYFDQALEIEPDEPYSRTYRADLRWSVYSDREGALEDLEVAIANPPERNAFPFTTRAHIYLQIREYELCVSDLNEAVAIEPENPWIYLDRGDCFEALSEYDAARNDYEQFLALIGDDPAYDYQRTRIQDWLDHN